MIVTKFVAAAEKIRNKFCFSLLSHNLPIRIANHNHHNYLFYYKMNIAICKNSAGNGDLNNEYIGNYIVVVAATKVVLVVVVVIVV